MQTDPATIAKAEKCKEQLMERDEVTRAAETAWRHSSGWCSRGSMTPHRHCVAGSPTRWCGSVNLCATTPSCATKVGDWIIARA